MTFKDISLPVMIERWGRNYWLIPTITVTVIVALLPIMLSLDRKIFSNVLADSLLTGYSAEAARLILSSISTALMTVIGVLFSITILVIQQASSQYSPRVVETFIKARNSKFVLGLYVGSFVYCILLLRQIPSMDDDEGMKIPQSAVTVGIALSLLCIGYLVQYVHFITHSIKSTRIISSIVEEALEYQKSFHEFQKSHSRVPAEDEPMGFTFKLKAHENGYFQSCLPEKMDKVFADTETQVNFINHIGHYCLEGDPIAIIKSDSPIDHKRIKRLQKSILFGRERTHAQDIRYSLKQLVDIALRALSPGINDPSTAVEALNGISIIVTEWLKLTELTGELKLKRGLVLRLPKLNFSDILEEAFGQIIVSAAGHYKVLLYIDKIMQSFKSDSIVLENYKSHLRKLYGESLPAFLINSGDPNEVFNSTSTH